MGTRGPRDSSNHRKNPAGFLSGHCGPIMAMLVLDFPLQNPNDSNSPTGFFFFFFFSRPDPATEQSRQGRPVTGQFPRNSASVSVWSVSESTAPTRRNARPPPWPSRPASDWRFGVINPMISCPPRPFSSGCSERRWILHGEQTRLRAVSALFQRNPPIPGGCRWGRGFG